MRFRENARNICRSCIGYYSDCGEIDELVQESLTAMIVKLFRGEEIENPKGFLLAVLRNRYNDWLRAKYRRGTVEYSDALLAAIPDDDAEKERERRSLEYAAVRREIGRLVRIYREVTVRHYVHGETVEEIARALSIPRGTVLSRLSSARGQIRKGIENMEKYAEISYEPKTVTIGIWGHGGLHGEPFSLVHSDIEANILVLAYEKPVSVREIADAMGMPSVYLEGLIEGMVRGELMGRTPGGLVYTRCFMQSYREAFGNIPAQERLAENYAERVWAVVWRHLEPLTEREAFRTMREKQKATMVLFVINQILNEVVRRSRPSVVGLPKRPPERPDAGRWLATCTVYAHGEKRDIPYEGSGPVQVDYRKAGDGEWDCIMLDRQSVFGEAHWAYNEFRYRFSLESILRFYASFLPCDVQTDNTLLYELIPEFERLSILCRAPDGEVRLDIPALPLDEVKVHWRPACKAIEDELHALLSDDLGALWRKTRRRVPRHVDEAEYFAQGTLGAFTTAELLAIVRAGLMPYPVTVGKTPLIFIAYRESER